MDMLRPYITGLMQQLTVSSHKQHARMLGNAPAEGIEAGILHIYIHMHIMVIMMIIMIIVMMMIIVMIMILTITIHLAKFGDL